MIVSPSNLDRYFKQLFNHILSESVRERLARQVEIVVPEPGEPFWNSQSSPPGIYLVLEGKVRLVDERDNLLVSLSEGMVLGQMSLFADRQLKPHAARASWNTKLGYLSHKSLYKYLLPKSKLEQHLYSQARRWDLLLECTPHRFQDPEHPQRSLQELLPILPSLEHHYVAGGEISPKIWDSSLLLLRRGKLLHSSGLKLIPGCQYTPQHLPKKGTWSIARSLELELYTLPPQLPQSANATTPSSSSLQIPSPKSVVLSKSKLNKLNQVTADAARPQKLYFPTPRVKFAHWWQQLTRRYPFLKQQSSSDCGVACMVMIGKYWGKNFSIAELRSIANVDRSGASIKGLIVAAEHLGFAPRPVKVDLPTLAKQKLPAIVHWRGNHYIVVYRVTRNKVIVSDPKIGRRHLTRPEFVKEWNGYTLLLSPTAKFKQVPEAERNVWKYFELLKPHWLVILEIIAASLMIQVLGLITPIFTQILLDRVVVQRSTSTLIAIGSGLIVFSLFGVAMSSLRRYLLYHTANKIDLSLIVGFISHTLRLPLSYFETRYVGDITSRIAENRKIRDFITGEAISTMLDVLSVFVYISLMLWYSWQLSLMALAVIPVFVINAVIFTPFLLKLSRENFAAKTSEQSYLIQAIKGIGTVKSMGVERNVRWRWEDLINESVRINFSGKMLLERLTVSTGIIQTLISQFTLLLGVWLVIQDQLTIGQLVAFNMLVGNVVSPFKRLIGLWNQFQEILVAVERLDDVINSPLEEDLTNEALVSLPSIKGYIRFEDVSFRYNLENETNTLTNLSFEIKPGQTVALVGRSGSGKTSIAKLLLGLYTPTSGKISIDGQDLNNVSLHSLRKQTGIVDQNTFLFGGTIKENLTVAHPQATMAELDRVCKLAGATEFIQEMPLKYETQIGEGGGLLSGGQRQRLAIARALLNNPRLLILDEATSNLDAESEQIIQSNLDTILKNQTTLVIAHRLSTVRNADLILVLDRGLLIESGTHAALMAKRGQYYYLNQQQIAFAN